MQIKSIRLKNFKRFGEDGLEIKFPPGLAVMRAPNESGKSTIVSAVAAGLFLNPKTAKIKTFQSWQSDKLPEIAIGFEEKGEICELTKNFNTKEASLFVIASGSKQFGPRESAITNFEQINKKIQEIFGFADPDIFESVFSVGQDAFYRLDEHKSTLQESLENLVTGGRRTVSDVASSLEKEITAITRQGLKNPGHLQRLKGEISRIEETLSDFDAKYHKMNTLTETLGVKTKEHNEAQKNLAVKKQLLKISKDILDGKKDLDRVDDNLVKLEDAHNDLAKLEKEMVRFESFVGIDIDKLRETAKDLARKVSFKKWSEESATSRFIRLNYNFLKYGLTALAVISLVAAYFNVYFLILSAVFAAFFGTLAFLNSKASATYQMRQSSRDLDAILKKFGAKTPEDLFQKISEYGALALEEAKINHFFSRLGGEKALFKQKEERKNILRFIDTAQIKAEEFKIDPLEDENDLKKLAREIDVLERDEEELKEEIAKIRGELNGMNFSGEDKIRLEELGESLTSQMDYWQKKMKISETARDMMIAAREKTLAGVKDKLSEYVSGSLALISGGRYDKVIIGEDLNFRVYSAEKGGEIVPEENLSRGAIDQFYLVVRFAFARILARGGKSFMLLDDPFHNFDGARKAYAKRLLQDLSADFQIIFFTHSDEYDGWGEKVELKTP